MAETGPIKSPSMRTPIARFRGLGAAHHGVEHWYSHRLSAIANVPLAVAFVIIVASIAGRPWAEAVRVLSNPFLAVLLALLMISVTYHMRLGLQTVIEDYVHDRLLKVTAGIANTFFAVAVAAASLFAIGKIGFGRVPMPPL